MSGAYLNALGIVCALGSGKKVVAERLFRGDDGIIRIAEAVTDGTELPFAPVIDDLPEIPLFGRQRIQVEWHPGAFGWPWIGEMRAIRED